MGDSTTSLVFQTMPLCKLLSSLSQPSSLPFQPFLVLERGKILSNTNLILAIGLLAITIIIGPTVQIFNTLTDSIGLYISNFFRMSFSAGSFGQYNRDWINTWTIFYWAWWISWSPFVGVFIARISKGRSIRQFLSIVLLAPTVLSFYGFLPLEHFQRMFNHLEM